MVSSYDEGGNEIRPSVYDPTSIGGGGKTWRSVAEYDPYAPENYSPGGELNGQLVPQSNSAASQFGDYAYAHLNEITNIVSPPAETQAQEAFINNAASGRGSTTEEFSTMLREIGRNSLQTVMGVTGNEGNIGENFIKGMRGKVPDDILEIFAKLNRSEPLTAEEAAKAEAHIRANPPQETYNSHTFDRSQAQMDERTAKIKAARGGAPQEPTIQKDLQDLGVDQSQYPRPAGPPPPPNPQLGTPLEPTRIAPLEAPNVEHNVGERPPYQTLSQQGPPIAPQYGVPLEPPVVPRPEPIDVPHQIGEREPYQTLRPQGPPIGPQFGDPLPPPDVPRGPSGEQLGTWQASVDRVNEAVQQVERAKASQPGIPGAKVVLPADQEILRRWIAGNRVMLDKVGTDRGIVHSVTATLKGDTPDSYLSAALRRKAVLRSALNAAGVPEDAVRAAVDGAFSEELRVHFPKGVPDEVNKILATTRDNPLLDNTELGALDTFVQRTKNSMFGLGDFGVMLNQVQNAVRRGGLPLLTGTMNRTLAGLSLPHIATELADSNLTRAAQLALDGVHSGITSSGAAPEVGTMVSYLGKWGKSVDRKAIIPFVDALTRVQFNNILTPIRNTMYDGDLVMLKTLGRDIQDPAVRAQAAENANVLSSFANQALDAGRRKAESRFLTSSSMTRAKIESITQMAKLLSPKASAEQRILAASMLASTYVLYATVGKAINDAIGIGEYEADPSAPGFGNIVTKYKNSDGQNITIDTVPQDSVERAFAQSLAVLAKDNGDIADAQRAWEKVGIGSGSLLTRGGLAAGFRTGFEPGQGYKYGDLSAGGVASSFLPIPPLAQQAGQNPSPLEVGVTAFGGSAYPASDVRGVVRQGNYGQLSGEQQFRGIPTQAWATSSSSLDPQYKRAASQFDSVGEWYDAAKASYLAKAVAAGSKPGEAERKAKEQTENNPIYKTYLAQRKALTNQWVLSNPEAAQRLDDEQADLPAEQRTFRPNKAQRGVLAGR